MSYEMKGTVKVVEETQTFSSGFQKREFVVTTAEKYPQDVKLEAVKDNCDKVGTLSVGDLVNVHFNVRGNEYQGRYFVNLQAWKIEVESKANYGEQGDSIEEEVEMPADENGEDLF